MAGGEDRGDGEPVSVVTVRVQYLEDTDPFACANFPEPRRAPTCSLDGALPLSAQIPALHRLLGAPLKLEDCALQVSPSGYYLDPELSLEEQREMLEGFYEEISKGRKPTLILRTQLSVRVNAILEKLYGSSGPELRRSLFSLKQIFQEDKDLVPEFVHSEGLSCLIRVGAAADHNYQSYILRALGQLMLFVDGMLGVVAHSETVQWLYTLCASLSRLVVKTALKLLLVFVEYSENNAPLFIQAVNSVACATGALPWANLVTILEEKNGADPELLVYTVTLINKTLAALPDQDSFYDVTDALEQQGMEALVQRHLGTAGTDVDLRTQLMLYEVGPKAPYDWKMETWKKQQPLQLQVVGGSDESPLQKRARGAADLWKGEAVLCVPQNLAPDGPALPTKRKTVKLFWRELKLAGDHGSSGNRFGPCPTLWASLEPVTVDTARLEHLFESRAKDVLPSKKAGEGRRTMTTVLDPKRSNAINIGLTTLPPVHVIKASLLNFDEFAVSKDGIEKLLTMMPTEEERQKIEEAQLANPDVPLGPAENFLMTLASIGGLAARLQLWAFKLDYDSMEREIAEPLFDLKVGMEQLVQNATFRCILATLLAVGNFLNGSQSSGFELSYLEKVSEVKDTVRRQSLLYHLCSLVLQTRPDSSDLYSEIPALTRCAKVDFDQLTENLGQLERRSQAAEENLRSLAKHELAPALRARLTHFLAHCTRRVAMLRVVHRRVYNRFHAFLLYLGYTAQTAREVRIMQFCHTLREFALEYRTCRERVLQQQQKRATYRERNKTRGRMITEVVTLLGLDCRPCFLSPTPSSLFSPLQTEKFSGVAGETPSNPSVPVAVGSGPGRGDADSHASMKSLLTSRPEDTTHGRRSRGMVQSSSPIMPSAGGPSTAPPEESPGSSLPSDTSDEIMDLLVQSVTKSSPRAATARERKRSRGNRKSLRRTLKSGLGDDLVQALGLSKTPGLEV
ncbi:FH1/FH2 domain-containing protein 1 [Sciurus carolinensis]|uniref:FH1/FH2 domain-containing protein 1 n=1 Tax=Sciurus carolinensis TaxID=30640 RepID=A0AA41NIX1_SCICA|nr:FH1/FH2 domain-containing protein 1 [Sciurus carolinensis]